MTDINIGDVVEVVATWDTPLASVAQNVWHYEMISGAGADSDDILDEVHTNLQVAFAAVDQDIGDEFSITLLEMRKWDFTLHRFDGVSSVAGSSLAGTSLVDYEPHGVAALGRILTENARRQGRTFLPGITEDAVASGVLLAAFETAFGLYLATFDGDIVVVGANLTWCTFNTDPLSPVFETTSLAIQTVVANSLPSYLGKRKPGVGL